jgi:putative aldouronate transport system permease protein
MGRRTVGWFDVINWLIMLFLIIITLYPIYYMAIISISGSIPVLSGRVHIWPIELNFDAYEIIFSDPSIVRAYGNTLLYTFGGVAINLVMTALCAYPLSRRHFYGRSFFSLFVVFTLFFSPGLIPLYMVVYSLGMVNTIWAILLPTAINAFYMILMRTFFENIPDELFEAAKMDGAGEFRTLFHVVIPISKPVMATMFLFYAVYHWNSFFPALIYLNHKSLYPLQIILRNIVVDGDLSDQANNETNINFTMISLSIKYAVIFVAVLPVLTIYPFVQKYFVQGSMLGSVKG